MLMSPPRFLAFAVSLGYAVGLVSNFSFFGCSLLVFAGVFMDSDDATIEHKCSVGLALLAKILASIWCYLWYALPEPSDKTPGRAQEARAIGSNLRHSIA
jgi:hypothetical protein